MHGIILEVAFKPGVAEDKSSIFGAVTEKNVSLIYI